MIVSLCVAAMQTLHNGTKPFMKSKVKKYLLGRTSNAQTGITLINLAMQLD